MSIMPSKAKKTKAKKSKQQFAIEEAVITVRGATAPSRRALLTPSTRTPACTLSSSRSAAPAWSTGSPRTVCVRRIRRLQRRLRLQRKGQINAEDSCEATRC